MRTLLAKAISRSMIIGLLLLVSIVLPITASASSTLSPSDELILESLYKQLIVLLEEEMALLTGGSMTPTIATPSATTSPPTVATPPVVGGTGGGGGGGGGSGNSIQPASGIFLLWDQGNVATDTQLAAHLDAALALPDVSGIALYIPWSDIEPQQGVFDWHVFDIALAEAAAYHKHAAIGLQVSAHSPQWAKDQAKDFSFNFFAKFTMIGKQTAPVPWDATYVQNLNDAIAHMAARYDGNPSLSYVQMTGPSTFFGVETNWSMQPNSISPADLAVLNFSIPAYVTAWEDSIQTYYTYFTKTTLGLSLNNEFSSFDHISVDQGTQIAQQIRDFAIAHYPQNGTKLAIRLLGLNDRVSNRYFNGSCSGSQGLTQYMSLAYDVRGQTSIQYQMATINRGVSTPEQFQTALSIGLSCGAHVIEVKNPDLLIGTTGTTYAPFYTSLLQANAQLTK